MEEAASCGFESLAFMGIIIGSLVASIGYSMFKNGKPKIENELTS